MQCSDVDSCMAWCQQQFDRYPWACVVLKVNSADISVLYVNPAYQQLTGYDLAEAKDSLLMGDPFVLHKGNEILTNALQQGLTQSLELLIHRHDGEYVWHDAHVAPVSHTTTKKPILQEHYMMVLLFETNHLVLPMRNLQIELDSERAHMEETLHSERLRTMGTMAASMAHEINNPVSGVLMNLHFLAEDCEEQEAQEILQDSIVEMRRISHLVQNLLSFSRKKLDTKTKAIHLTQEVLSRTLAMLHGHFISNMVELVNEIPDNTPLLQADPDALQQVLLNLIANAIYVLKDNPIDQRFIWLSYELYDNFVLISVRDNGPGIPEILKDKIFDAFTTTKPKGEGTGLGLSLSANLMLESGGKLLLDERYHQGAKFDLYIPIHKVREQNDERANPIIG